MLVEKPTPLEPVRQAWEPRYTPEKAREVCQRFKADGIKHVRITLDTTGEYGGKGSFWVEVEAPFNPPMTSLEPGPSCRVEQP
jgi:hypothetical protein